MQATVHEKWENNTLLPLIHHNRVLGLDNTTEKHKAARQPKLASWHMNTHSKKQPTKTQHQEQECAPSYAPAPTIAIYTAQ